MSLLNLNIPTFLLQLLSLLSLLPLLALMTLLPLRHFLLPYMYNILKKSINVLIPVCVCISFCGSHFFFFPLAPPREQEGAFKAISSNNKIIVYSLTGLNTHYGDFQQS